MSSLVIVGEIPIAILVVIVDWLPRLVHPVQLIVGAPITVGVDRSSACSLTLQSVAGCHSVVGVLSIAARKLAAPGVPFSRYPAVVFVPYSRSIRIVDTAHSFNDVITLVISERLRVGM